MPAPTQGHYATCVDCGCRLEMNGVCKICAHADDPILPGVVVDVTGVDSAAAALLLTGPECQLALGVVSFASDEGVSIDDIISSDSAAGVVRTIGDSVNIVVSTGPA